MENEMIKLKDIFEAKISGEPSPLTEGKTITADMVKPPFRIVFMEAGHDGYVSTKAVEFAEKRTLGKAKKSSGTSSYAGSQEVKISDVTDVKTAINYVKGVVDDIKKYNVGKYKDEKINTKAFSISLWDQAGNVYFTTSTATKGDVVKIGKSA